MAAAKTFRAPPFRHAATACDSVSPVPIMSVDDHGYAIVNPRHHVIGSHDVIEPALAHGGQGYVALQKLDQLGLEPSGTFDASDIRRNHHKVFPVQAKARDQFSRQQWGGFEFWRPGCLAWDRGFADSPLEETVSSEPVSGRKFPV